MSAHQVVGRRHPALQPHPSRLSWAPSAMRRSCAFAVAAAGWTAGTDDMLAVLQRHTGAAGVSAAAAFEQAAAVAAGRLATAVAVISAEYAADTARIDFPGRGGSASALYRCRRGSSIAACTGDWVEPQSAF